MEAGSPLCVTRARQTIPALQEALNLARKAGIQIFWVCRRHAADGSDMERFRKEKLEKAGCLDLFAPESWGIALAGGLEKEDGDQIVWKKRFSAFFETGLEAKLKEAGIQTPNCVRATAIDALQKGYETIVLASCTSSMTPVIQQSNLDDMENAGIAIAGQLRDLL